MFQFCSGRYCESFLVWTLHYRFTFHRNMLFSKGWFWGGWKEKKHFWGNLLERIESFLLVGQISRIKRGPGVPFPRMQKYHKGGFQKTSWVKSLSSGQTSLGLCYDFFYKLSFKNYLFKEKTICCGGKIKSIFVHKYNYFLWMQIYHKVSLFMDASISFGCRNIIKYLCSWMQKQF